MKKILFFLIFFIHLHINYDDGRFMIFHFQEVQAQVMQREDGYYVCWDEKLHESYVSSVSTCDVDFEKYKCSKCPATFDTESERDSHQNDCKGGGYRCGYCNKELSDPSARDDHQRTCSKNPANTNSSQQSGNSGGNTGSNTNGNTGTGTGGTGSSSSGTAVTVNIASDVKWVNDSVKQKAIRILKRSKGNNEVKITSQKRTAESQAKAMLKNIKDGRNIKYRTAGETVKQQYDSTKTDAENIKAMVDKINEIGPEKISIHLRTSEKAAVDVSKSGINADTLRSCLENDSDVTKVIFEPHCIHFEFNY